MKGTGFFYLFGLSCLILISSCRKNPERKWDTDLLIPLAHSVLTIEDIVPDSIRSTNDDGAVNLVYSYPLYEFDPSKELIEIPDTIITQTLTLDSLFLASESLNHKLTLGQFARQMEKSPNLQAQLLGSLILQSHGDSNLTIPALAGVSSQDEPIDGSQFFQTATFISGFLVIEIENGFPLDIQNVVFELKNANLGTVIIRDTFPYIPAYSKVKDSVDVSGQTVEGDLAIQIINLDSPGGSGIAIDTTDALTVTFSTSNLRVSNATAVWPSQDIINSERAVEYKFGGPELTFIKVKQGRLSVDIVSTIQDSIKFSITLPTARNDLGQVLSSAAVVPPAPPNGTSRIQKDLDISGYNISLKGTSGSLVNRVEQVLKARIDSTGKVVNISLNDSLYIYYGLLDIVPQYVKGYIGSDTTALAGANVKLDLFRNIASGSLETGKINARFSIDNGIGADGMAVINKFTAKKGSKKVDLNSNIIGKPLPIVRASDEPFRRKYTSYSINSDNSNINDLLEIFPNQVDYDADLYVNPLGNNYNYQDFAYFDHGFKVNFDVDMPLSFIAKDLLMVDTVDINLFGTGGDVDNIVSGYLYLISYNGFPVDLDVQMLAYDEQFNFIDSLFTTTTIKAASLDPVNCRVKDVLRTRLETFIDRSRIDGFSRAEKAVISVRYNTKSDVPECAGQKLKIYSDYDLDLTLSARFNYVIEENF